ncbi:MAG: hypothetical protein JWN61_1610 [Pseudonocardiales bacterium]|jgi:hypothetical protein|nr:hypothetical protein [Pseudonocardiales bacterium]
MTVRRPAHETASLACGLEFPFVEQLRLAGEEQGVGNWHVPGMEARD